MLAGMSALSGRFPLNQNSDQKVTNMKDLIFIVSVIGLSALALAQDTKPARINPADAKGQVGQNATVCGRVVDNEVSKNGLGGYGRPVSFYLDQPRKPNPVFYFIAFGVKAQAGVTQEVVQAYDGKRVCVTGKIETQAGGTPFILAADRSQIKPEASSK
jgi:hypothetical protein